MPGCRKCERPQGRAQRRWWLRSCAPSAEEARAKVRHTLALFRLHYPAAGDDLLRAPGSETCYSVQLHARETPLLCIPHSNHMPSG